MTYPYLPVRWVITDESIIGDPDIFPILPGQNFLSLKTPSFSTGIRTASSGRTVRTNFWTAPIWLFEVSYEVIRDKPPTLPELAQLRAFFSSKMGQFAFFYYLDPLDNVVTNQQFGVGTGTQTVFQMVRDVGAGTAYSFQEPVYVFNGTPTVTVNGEATTAFTIGSWGSITFDEAPAADAVLAWSGSFMFLCHFTVDQMNTKQIFKQMWSEDGITFESLKP